MRAMLPTKRQRVVGTAAMAVYLIAFAMSEDSGADARRGRMCQRIETTLLGQRITPTAYAIDGDDIAQIECRDTDEIRDFLRRDLSDETGFSGQRYAEHQDTRTTPTRQTCRTFEVVLLGTLT